MDLPLVIITAVDQLRSFVAAKLTALNRGKSDLSEPLPVYQKNLTKVTRLASARALTVSFQPIAGSPPSDTGEGLQARWTLSEKESLQEVVAFVGQEDSEPELLALLHAVYTNRPFVTFTSLPGVACFLATRSVRSLLLFVPALTFDPAMVAELKGAAPDLRLGIWPYVDSAGINHFTLKYLLFRKFPPRPAFLVIDRGDTLTARHLIRDRAGDTEYCDNQNSTFEHLEQLLQESDLLELNYLSHCRECTLRFKDFFYCGAGDQQVEVADASKHWPCCHYDGRCYIRDKRKMDSASLDASIMMLIGCNLADLNHSVVPYHFNVVARLLDHSAVSLVTTVGIRTAQFAENILAHQLLTHGYCEGDKVHFLNQFLEYGRLETVDYLQLGDPTLRIDGIGVTSAPVVVEQSHHTLDVEIPEIRDDSYLEVDLPSIDDCEIDIGSYHLAAVVLHTDAAALAADRDTFYGILKPDRTRARLVVFSNRGGLEGMSLRLATYDVLAEKLERLLSYREALLHLRGNFTIHGLSNDYLELDNTLKSFLRHYGKRRYSLYSFATAAERSKIAQQKFEAVFEKIFRQLVTQTRKKRANYFETALERYLEIVPLKAESCSSCRSSVTPSSCRSLSLERKVCRLNYRCSSCNINQDVADQQLVLSSFPHLSFDGSGRPLAVLRVENRHAHSIRVHAAVICLDSSAVTIEPELSAIGLDSGATHELKVVFRPGAELSKGYYLFAFYVMAEGKFYYLSNMIGFV